MPRNQGPSALEGTRSANVDLPCCFTVLGGIIPHLIVVVLFSFESTSLVVIWVSVAGRADEVMSSLNIVNNFFFCFVFLTGKDNQAV